MVPVQKDEGFLMNHDEECIDQFTVAFHGREKEESRQQHRTKKNNIIRREYVRKFAEAKHLHPESCSSRAKMRLGIEAKVFCHSIVHEIVD